MCTRIVDRFLKQYIYNPKNCRAPHLSFVPLYWGSCSPIVGTFVGAGTVSGNQVEFWRRKQVFLDDYLEDAVTYDP